MAILRRWWLVLLAVGVCLAGPVRSAEGPAASALQRAPDGVCWVVFASATCEECEWLKSVFFPELEGRFGQKAPPIAFVDIDDLENYALLLEVEDALVEESGSEFPAFLVGSSFYYGQDAIAAWGESLRTGIPRLTLPKAAAGVLSRARNVTYYDDLFAPRPAGGGSAAATPGVVQPLPSPAPEAALRPGEVDHHRHARVLYFETTGCRSCARAEKQLAYALTRVPDASVRRVLTEEAAGRALQYAVTSRLGLPPSQRLLTPMFVSGDASLSGKAIGDQALIEMLRTAPGEPFWWSWDEGAAVAEARRRIEDLAAGFAIPTVLVAGLIDGVNPCAFAVIVFLVSYLTLTGRFGRRFALWYGLTFAAGVFVCYFLIGIGFFRLLAWVQAWQSAMRWVFVLMGLVCVAFGIGGILDTVAAVRDGVGKMKFGMPKSLHRVVHRLIREDVSRHALGVGAFLIGILVSTVELVCTGQIYLPVILFINSSAPGLRSLGLLTVYNLAFILPLVVVVVLGAAGLGSEALSKWARRHAVLTRALTCILVFGLAGVMFYMAARA
ncbi:MAG: hypothetical protein JXR77_11440 [Lentisphaeria bacterium]|nr:hypothetical protein [Lentisphaeria bacterium]